MDDINGKKCVFLDEIMSVKISILVRKTDVTPLFVVYLLL